MIKHVVIFNWHPEVTTEQVAALQQNLEAFATTLEGCIEYAVGANAGFCEGTADFAVVATFETEEAWRTYFEHPDHRRIVVEQIGPMAASRLATQIRH
ncbi:Dabb family protein [Gulosibacter macacae]|uniref:Dabb family protein n=1 Tax=Gulosibacter macacae TaxID=2488791 RepID=A0A3P3VXL5_9MICO|nr:Dabb family protein [Gulosibacter macacae]RRJ87531.1 Dabb family protein [Gulosibacter macacae]